MRFQISGVVALLLPMLVAPLSLNARQRVYLAGPAVNLIGGGNNNPRLPATSLAERPLAFFYGVYPSVTLSATDATSTVNASYRFGAEWTGTAPRVRSDSHAASFSWAEALDRRWGLTLSESFSVTADSRSFNTFTGVVPGSEDVAFVFDPIAIGLSSKTNTVAIALGHTLSGRSNLAFNASHSLRTNGGGDIVPSGLGSQQSVTAGFTYSHQTTTEEAWNFGFSSARNFFGEFDDSRSHTGFVGYSNQLAPELSLQITVGASRAASLGSAGSSVGYNTSVGLSRTFENGSFDLDYAQTFAQPSGLGSTSDTRRFSVTANRTFGDATLSANASAFDSRGTLGNPFDTRGVSGAATIAFALGETLSLRGGVQIQRTTQAAEFDFSQSRVFFSLEYSDPDLWRFVR